ncbi:uncharacterized protein F5Z01DRAFT_491421 [Emericellopsis atlantica]|uniref:Uncharacterized protein n=1 Tax=Emericellopsis atlantica TaxID=2614577 RepID=A0A9P8CS01_9HYPO|nr:uncharacterized protein F5Z01DRAFT_491421 [Emericellopsis atlantica]KAG9256872.1 hypothetical protein F5Z01DRAFT_491421 [Emericellopsis atlantica]
MSFRGLAFLVAESCLSLAALVVFTAVFVGDYRMKAWLNGGGEGWNSDPAQRVYFYANFKEPPEIPTIWTQALSKATLGMAILTVVWLFVHGIASRHHYISLGATLACETFIALLWIYITLEQCSSDLTDEEHLSQYPWFLTRACSRAWDDAKAACHTLRAGFYLSLVIVCMFCGRIILSIHTLSCGRPRELGYTKAGTGSSYHLGATEDDDEAFELRSSEDDRQQALRDAISPVLAFFPASHSRSLDEHF